MNLSEKEIAELVELGKSIVLGLECNVNGTGLPCRTDRLHTVELMKEYLVIHDYKIKEV